MLAVAKSVEREIKHLVRAVCDYDPVLFGPIYLRKLCGKYACLGVRIELKHTRLLKHRAENGGRWRKRGFVCVQLDVFFVTRLLARGIGDERSELPAEKSAHITRFQNAR